MGIKLGSLKKGNDIKDTLSKGKRITERYIRAAILENTSRTIRVTIVASKKLGSAVERNRIRRRVKEAIRAEIDKAGKGADIIIFPDITTKIAPFIEIRRSFERILNKARLI